MQNSQFLPTEQNLSIPERKQLFNSSERKAFSKAHTFILITAIFVASFLTILLMQTAVS